MNLMCKILLENNPFYSSSHPDPWVKEFANISSINGEVFNPIINIIEQSRKKPTEPVGILVKGESGSGKTHMIARIREHCEKTSFETKFATIKPIIDYHTPLQRILKGIITNLAHPIAGSRKKTQIHGMVFSIICDFYKHQPGTQSIIQNMEMNDSKFFSILCQNQQKMDVFFRNLHCWILQEVPGLNSRFIKLLLSFCNPDLQQIAYMRLIGEISDSEEADLLHVPFQEYSDPAMEDEARDFLISLGLILSRYNQNLIVCFDQLESMSNQDLIKAFGQVIFTIVNDCNAIIPLTFTRTLFWDNVLYPSLDPSVEGKLAMTQWNLRGCNDREIDDIIKTRIMEILPENWNEPYSWLLSEVKKVIHKNPSPREVIRCANTIIHNCDASPTLTPALSPDEVIHAAFTNEREQIVSDMDSWPPDHYELTDASISYLQARGYQVKHIKSGQKSILKISMAGKKCCIIVNTNRNHSSVGSGFLKGTRFLNDNPGTTCIYLTDPRCILTKSSWKHTNQLKDEFITAGGMIFQPSISEIARYYALYSLSCKITEQDILIDTKTGIRPVNKDELSSYIKNKTKFISLFQKFTNLPETTEKVSFFQDEHVHEAMYQILSQKSMHIMAAGTLSQEISRKGINITQDELLAWCGKHVDSYRILQSQQGSMIILRGKVHP